MTTTAIELIDLVKTFQPPREDPVRAVAGIDLSIDRGEVMALLGPNGAGKTTTIDMLLGLTEPTSGTARVFDERPRAAIEAGKVSAVLQSGGLLRDLSVAETVHVIASMFPVHQDEQVVLEQAGISHLAKRKIAKCSGGEQQRVRFALALLPDPDLIVLDEPTAGMDVTAREHFWRTMQDLATSGRTIVFATHYLAEAESYAERIVLMSRGEIVADGGVEDLRDVAGDRTVIATVPDPEAAIAHLRRLGATFDHRDGDRVFVTAKNSDQVALTLLSELGASDLEVRLPSLDQAFQLLTSPGEEN